MSRRTLRLRCAAARKRIRKWRSVFNTEISLYERLGNLTTNRTRKRKKMYCEWDRAVWENVDHRHTIFFMLDRFGFWRVRSNFGRSLESHSPDGPSRCIHRLSIKRASSASAATRDKNTTNVYEDSMKSNRLNRYSFAHAPMASCNTDVYMPQLL